MHYVKIAASQKCCNITWHARTETRNPYIFVAEMGQLILSTAFSLSPVYIASQGHITLCMRVCL